MKPSAAAAAAVAVAVAVPCDCLLPIRAEDDKTCRRCNRPVCDLRRPAVVQIKR